MVLVCSSSSITYQSLAPDCQTCLSNKLVWFLNLFITKDNPRLLFWSQMYWPFANVVIFGVATIQEHKHNHTTHCFSSSSAVWGTASSWTEVDWIKCVTKFELSPFAFYCDVVLYKSIELSLTFMGGFCVTVKSIIIIIIICTSVTQC